MGFLKHLLFWPVTGPTFLARFSLEKVQGVVRDELTDDQRIKEALLDLQLRLELGEIDDEEYAREEEAIMAQLREVRRWREEFGMGTRGGVVRVAGPEPHKAEAEAEAQAESEAEAGATASERGAAPRALVPAGARLEVTLGWEEEGEEEVEEGEKAETEAADTGAHEEAEAGDGGTPEEDER